MMNKKEAQEFQNLQEALRGALAARWALCLDLARTLVKLDNQMLEADD